MIRYLKFFINGGVLGLLSLALQAAIYWLLGGNSAVDYAVATAIAYVPLVFLNYAIQRAWIFQTEGLFMRFILANLVVMGIVSLLSPACRALVAMVSSAAWGDRLGFAFAALLGSVPSFFIKKHFVFGGGLAETGKPTPRG